MIKELIIQSFLNWNIILIILLFTSIISIAIFIERMLVLKRSEIDTGQFLLSLRKDIEKNDLVKAISFCEESKGSLPRVIKAGLLKHQKTKEQIENAMEIAGTIEIAKLEKNAKTLSIIAHIAPLLGLLGTVLGFMRAFSEMRRSGLMDISATRIGEAMEYALVTTAAGLVVAIPTIVAFNYIVSRVQQIVLEMQTTSPEIVEILVEKQENHEF
jgi:biopolymer transport protein ExbB